MQIIEGFKCYSPELAFTNDGFDAESFEMLYEVEAKSFWFLNRNRVISQLMQRFTVSGKFLEIGCGNGIVLEHLQVNFPKINFIGSEIYLEGLRRARTRLGSEIELIQFDAANVHFHQHFGAVGAFDVIEHIEDDVKVLDNIYLSLVDGGRVFISVPQYSFMWSNEDDLACHKRRYSRSDLLKKLENAGFKVEFVSSFIFLLFPIMFVSRFLSRNRSVDLGSIKNALYPGKFLNAFLSLICRLDTELIRFGLSLPWGGSLIVVARKDVAKSRL